MAGEAIGMIETRGLIGSIEAADAMVKAANVRLVSKEYAGSGQVPKNKVAVIKMKTD